MYCVILTEQVLHKGQTDLGNNKEKYRTDHEEYCRKRSAAHLHNKGFLL